LPLRDVFVAMFFVTVGMLVDPFTVAANLPLLAALIVLIVVGKAVIRSAIVRLFGYPWSTAARVGVGLAQIGEFSFILVQVARGAPCVFGDAAHRELLARAGVARAPLVIVALPEIERARLAVAAVRALRADVPLLARAHGRAEAEALRAKGATEIIQPELEASATLIRHALAALGLPKDRTIAYLERYRSAMERADAGDAAAAVPLPEVR